jgi:hypothetical protein
MKVFIVILLHALPLKYSEIISGKIESNECMVDYCTYYKNIFDSDIFEMLFNSIHLIVIIFVIVTDLSSFIL